MKPDPKRNFTEERKARKEASKALKEKNRPKTRRIAKVSKTNTYKDSTGKSWTSSQIERKIRDAKEKKNLDSDGSCENCKRNGLRIDKSHIISILYAKNNHMTELCWDIKNLQDLCRNCHLDLETFNAQERLSIYKSQT